MNESEYRTAMGAVFARLGRRTLEGQFVALMLTRSAPVRLAEAAALLGVTKTALRDLALEMLRRGDLKRHAVFSSREHAYNLVDHAYIAPLRDMRDASREIAEACAGLSAHASVTDPKIVLRLQYMAGLYAQTGLATAQTLSAEEKLQAAELASHREGDWDALPPRDA